MNLSEKLEQAAKVIREKTNITPKAGLILGSGLGALADDIESATVISYADIPGMPTSTVAGHAGELVIGLLRGVPVACYKGRVHYYEGRSNEDFQFFIRLLKAIGCKAVFITNAAGSLRANIPAGELVLINDHINLQFRNPLIGPNDDEAGPRFFPVDSVYDSVIREQMHETAKQCDITLSDGVYCAVLGPNFETPAEIRAFRTLGADVVGMSTVPDVLTACHCGLRVCVISGITNLSADLNEEPLTHDITLKYGKLAAKKMRLLMETYLEHHGNEL